MWTVVAKYVLLQCYRQLDQLPQKVVATITQFSTTDWAEQTIQTFKMFWSHLSFNKLHTALLYKLSYHNFSKSSRDKETIWITMTWTYRWAVNFIKNTEQCFDESCCQSSILVKNILSWITLYQNWPWYWKIKSSHCSFKKHYSGVSSSKQKPCMQKHKTSVTSCIWQNFTST